MDVSINCGRAGPHTGREKIGMVILMGTGDIRYFWPGVVARLNVPISMGDS